MAMENSGLSVADALALQNRGDDGMFGGNGMWVFFLFFLLAWGGNGWGFGGGMDGRVATQADVQRGFDTQAVINKLNGLENGLCDGFYAVNTGMLNGFNGVQRDLCQGFGAVNSAIAENRFAAQQCCCETNRNIDAVRYENAQNTCAITNAIHAEGEQTRALLNAQENQRLRDELDQARGIISNTNQSQYILGQLGRYYSNPPCYNSCGNNYGLGIGLGLGLGLGYGRDGGFNEGCYPR